MQEQSISELQEKMTSGELTARQLAELFLERIDLLDRNGPRLNSVIETNPDALAYRINPRRGAAWRQGAGSTPRHSHPT